MIVGKKTNIEIGEKVATKAIMVTIECFCASGK